MKYCKKLMFSSILAIAMIAFSAFASANCGNDKSVGNDCSGGSGVTAPATSSTSVSSSVSSSSSTAVAVSGAIAGSVSNASANNSGSTNVSNSMSTGNVRALSLGAASVGAPASDTCVAYFAVGFGLVTTPVQMESCIALQQALVLEHFGLKDAAIARLCQLKEIAKTGICPPQLEAKAEIKAE